MSGMPLYEGPCAKNVINMMENIILTIQISPSREKNVSKWASERERARMCIAWNEIKYVKSIKFTFHFEHASRLGLKSNNNISNNKIIMKIIWARERFFPISFSISLSLSFVRPLAVFCFLSSPSMQILFEIESNWIRYKTKIVIFTVKFSR